jgi:uncharacterized membrane protein (UPF0127 family)
MIRRRLRNSAVILIFAAFAGIGGDASAVELPVEPLVIEAASGAHHFQVEVARSAEERAIGLMFRTELAPDKGMLFDFGRVAPVIMWMKNTLIALDMLFIDDDGTVVRIAENTEPFSEAHIPSGAPVRAVLELVAGSAAILGLAAGDRVRHPVFGNAPEN